MQRILFLLFFALLAAPVFAQKREGGKGGYDKTYQIGDTTVFWKKVGRSAYLKHFKDSTWLFTKRIRNKKGGEVEIVTVEGWVSSKRNGPAFWYYSSGEQKVAYQYKGDKLDGPATWYFKSGNTKTRAIFRKNKLNGAYLTFFENGSQQCVCWYSAGKRDGLQRVFYPNGQLKAIWEYKKGRVLEVPEQYAPDGSPLPRGTLKNGYGKLNEYDDAGRLVKIWTYKKGKEKRRPRTVK